MQAGGLAQLLDGPRRAPARLLQFLFRGEGGVGNLSVTDGRARHGVPRTAADPGVEIDLLHQPAGRLRVSLPASGVQGAHDPSRFEGNVVVVLLAVDDVLHRLHPAPGDLAVRPIDALQEEVEHRFKLLGLALRGSRTLAQLRLPGGLALAGP